MNCSPDLVAIVHSAFVAFVIVGFILIVTGDVFHWHWTRNFYFRAAHLLAIGFVTLRTWLAVPCPLTVLETRLRATPQSGSEISALGHTLHRFSFAGMDARQFKMVVTAFAVVVGIEVVWTLVRRWRYHSRSAKS